MTRDYVDRAASVEDREVKKWMQADNVHLISVGVGSSGKDRDSEGGVCPRRKAHVQQSESIRDIILDDIHCSSLSSAERNSDTISSLSASAIDGT